MTGVEALANLGAQSAVAVAAVGGKLEEVFALDPLIEFLGVRKW